MVLLLILYIFGKRYSAVPELNTPLLSLEFISFRSHVLKNRKLVVGVEKRITNLQSNKANQEGYQLCPFC